jgi:hypothetical protein
MTAPTMEEQVAFLAEWDRWLDRGEPFAVLRVFASEAALTHPEGGAREAKQWMQRNGERIRHHVMGLASVVPPSQYERMSRMDMARAFGVPAAVFADTAAALAWLEDDVFRSHALPLDRVAAEAALGRLRIETG